jgi:N-acetyl-gamma-glutamyl-phosphate reductase
MLSAGVLGATGYTGIELIGLLSRHPDVELRFAASESSAGRDLADVFPGAVHSPLVHPKEAPVGDVDVLFLCLPHTASASEARRGLEEGTRVIDLSADFRLKDAGVYAKWYGVSHPYPELLTEAVYGLTEVERANIADAKLVANPGCYPASALLALWPLAREGAIDGQVIIDAKSGVSGAGRSPKQETHFVEVADNFKPYSIGRAHRHLPEIEQQLSAWTGSQQQVIFSPHLLPVPRGLLSTIYVQLSAGWDEPRVRDAFERVYADEPFIRLLPPGQAATLRHVNHTNLCAIGICLAAARTLIVTSAIDNLLKGASGQAVQNMNVMFGLEETEGLLA